ncbi:MAG: hypothetical protein ACR2QB_09005 [Gammaproteobacteria bacterium]
MHIWLTKPIYEVLPYFYLGAGLAVLSASMYLNYWYWPAICVLAGITLVTGGLVLWLKRRDFRQTQRPSGLQDLD